MSDLIVLAIFPITICRLLWIVRSYNSFVLVIFWVFIPAGKDSSSSVVDIYLVGGLYNSVTSLSAALTSRKEEFWAYLNSLAYSWQVVIAHGIGRERQGCQDTPSAVTQFDLILDVLIVFL